eukprot:PhM_4_TR13208/c0_g1_i1/m.53124
MQTAVELLTKIALLYVDERAHKDSTMLTAHQKIFLRLGDEAARCHGVLPGQVPHGLVECVGQLLPVLVYGRLQRVWVPLVGEVLKTALRITHTNDDSVAEAIIERLQKINGPRAVVDQLILVFVFVVFVGWLLDADKRHGVSSGLGLRLCLLLGLAHETAEAPPVVLELALKGRVAGGRRRDLNAYDIPGREAHEDVRGVLCVRYARGHFEEGYEATRLEGPGRVVDREKEKCLVFTRGHHVSEATVEGDGRNLAHMRFAHAHKLKAVDGAAEHTDTAVVKSGVHDVTTGLNTLREESQNRHCGVEAVSVNFFLPEVIEEPHSAVFTTRHTHVVVWGRVDTCDRTSVEGLNWRLHGLLVNPQRSIPHILERKVRHAEQLTVGILYNPVIIVWRESYRLHLHVGPEEHLAQERDLAARVGVGGLSCVNRWKTPVTDEPIKTSREEHLALEEEQHLDGAVVAWQALALATRTLAPNLALDEVALPEQ